MEQAAAVRDLEQIQEQDEATRTPRALTIALVGIGGACIAFAVLAMGGRKTASNEKRPDPLGELVASHGKGVAGSAAPPAAAVTQLAAKDVTFPSILSDDARPTTALAAVRSQPAPSAPARSPSADRQAPRRDLRRGDAAGSARRRPAVRAGKQRDVACVAGHRR